MKYLFQLAVILTLSFIAELLSTALPLPIPPSIWGLLLMLLLLSSKWLKLHYFEETGNYLIHIMPIMFVPALVGIMNDWRNLSQLLLPFMIVAIFVTILVMGLTGRLVQWLIKKEQNND